MNELGSYLRRTFRGVAERLQARRRRAAIVAPLLRSSASPPRGSFPQLTDHVMGVLEQAIDSAAGLSSVTETRDTWQSPSSPTTSPPRSRRSSGVLSLCLSCGLPARLQLLSDRRAGRVLCTQWLKPWRLPHRHSPPRHLLSCPHFVLSARQGWHLCSRVTARVRRQGGPHPADALRGLDALPLCHSAAAAARSWRPM